MPSNEDEAAPVMTTEDPPAEGPRQSGGGALGSGAGRDSSELASGIGLEIAGDEESPPPSPLFVDGAPAKPKPPLASGIDLEIVGDEEAPPPSPLFGDGAPAKPNPPVLKGFPETVSDTDSGAIFEEAAASAHDDSVEKKRAQGKGSAAETIAIPNLPLPPVPDPAESGAKIDAGDQAEGMIGPRSGPVAGVGPYPEQEAEGQARGPSTSPLVHASGGTGVTARAVAAAPGDETASASFGEDGEILVPVATLVEEGDEIPSATVVRPKRYSLTIAGRTVHLRWAALGMIALLGTTIALGVAFSGRGGETYRDEPLPETSLLSGVPSWSTSPSLAPSLDPSAGPTRVLQADLVGIISNYSGGKPFPGTLSHERALSWLVDDQHEWPEQHSPLTEAEIAERFVLALLFYETGGEGWHKNFGFASRELKHVCDWKGRLYMTLSKGVINCTKDTRQVTELALPGNNLQGKLPTEIGMLRELTALQVGFNDIKGGVPGTLGSLRSITRLELNNNDLSGPIDPLAGLESLQFADLSNNEMTGSLVDARNMSKLRSFNVSGNKLSGSVPPSFSNISSLETFHLQYNELSGDIDFMCKAQPVDHKLQITLDCEGDEPELACSCCIGCTIVNDVECNPEDEMLISLDIYAGELINFQWELRDDVDGAVIVLGGDYDVGQHVNVRKCLAFPRTYSISTRADSIPTPWPTFSPLTATPTHTHYPSGSPSLTATPTDTLYPTRLTPRPTPYPTEDTPRPTPNQPQSRPPYTLFPTYRVTRSFYPIRGTPWPTPNPTRSMPPYTPSPQQENQPFQIEPCVLLPTGPTPSGAPFPTDPCIPENVGLPAIPTDVHDSGSDTIACGNFTAKKQCIKMSAGQCLWNSNERFCIALPLAPKPPNLPTHSPVKESTIPAFIEGSSGERRSKRMKSALHEGVSFSIADQYASVGPNEAHSFVLAAPAPSSNPSLSSQPSSTGSPTLLSTYGSSSGSTPTVGYEMTLPPTWGCLGAVFELVIVTDAFGQDTNWKLINPDSGGIIASQWGLASNQTHEFKECLRPHRCYDFVIEDSWGDGICCQQGEGSYNVSVNGVLFGSGGEFGSSETVSIGESCGENAAEGWLLARQRKLRRISQLEAVRQWWQARRDSKLPLWRRLW